MATWQAGFAIIPTGRFPAEYRDRLDAIAPRYTSWSSDILAWGVEDGDRVEIYHENGQPVDGSIRIDLREPDARFIRAILEFVRSAGFGLEDELGRWIEPVEGEFMLALRGSRAYRFVENPELFFRRLELGGLDDA